MYAQSKTDDPSDAFDLRVGIAASGYYPDNVAVHDISEITWGPSHRYYMAWGPLTVTAEAVGTSIAAYTHAYIYPAQSIGTYLVWWDTGSFQEATPDLLSDPDNLPASSGISGLGISAGSTSAIVSWTTASALGQAYYRPLPAGSTAPPTLTHTVYLPVVIGPGGQWQSTSLNKSFQTSHSEAITGLQPDTTYEVIVASRGLSGAQCATWVSGKHSFTTGP